MNFCGECGARLDATALAGGVCPACGAPLDPTGGPTAPGSQPAPYWAGSILPQPASRRELGRIALIAGIAVVVLLAATGLVLAIHGTWGGPGMPQTAHGAHGMLATHTPSPTTSPSAVVSPSSTSADATVGADATATPAPGSTATDTPAAPTPAPPADTVTPDITLTPDALPALSVSPTSINLGPCATKTTSFTVSNSGGGSLDWSASSSTVLITLSPESGTVTADQPQTVSVQDTAASGTVTVTSSDASGSPQTVTITCQGPV